MVELAVKRGADVFVRDRKGRRVLEGEKGADERIKVFLRQCQSLFRLHRTFCVVYFMAFSGLTNWCTQSIIRRTQCNRELMDDHRISEDF